MIFFPQQLLYSVSDDDEDDDDDDDDDDQVPFHLWGKETVRKAGKA